MNDGIDFEADESVQRDFGPCCACGRDGPTVRNFIMLDKKAPVAGTGWGCFRCGLSADGATAVICDDCLIHSAERKIRFVCRGNPTLKLRTPIEELRGVHEHDLAYHPEVACATN